MIARYLCLALVVLFLTPHSHSAQAQQILDSYVAFIGQEDLYNSAGERLTRPWQILRQDRANYHRFGIRQPGDEGDSFFGSIDNRALMERMIMNGSIQPSASRSVVSGGSMVVVTIYRSGGRDWVEVDVWD